MSSSNKPSLGWAVFILIAGFALLAERLGWIPSDMVIPPAKSND